MGPKDARDWQRVPVSLNRFFELFYLTPCCPTVLLPHFVQKQQHFSRNRQKMTAPSLDANFLRMLPSGDGTSAVKRASGPPVSDEVGATFSTAWTEHGNSLPFDEVTWTESAPPVPTQVLAAGFQDGVKHFYVADVDGSSVVEIVPSLSIGEKLTMEAVAWSPEIPPNVTSLSPFSQTVSAFFLGVIATLMLLRQRGVLDQQA